MAAKFSILLVLIHFTSSLEQINLDQGEICPKPDLQDCVIEKAAVYSSVSTYTVLDKITFLRLTENAKIRTETFPALKKIMIMSSLYYSKEYIKNICDIFIVDRVRRIDVFIQDRNITRVCLVQPMGTSTHPSTHSLHLSTQTTQSLHTSFTQTTHPSTTHPSTIQSIHTSFTQTTHPSTSQSFHTSIPLSTYPWTDTSGHSIQALQYTVIGLGIFSSALVIVLVVVVVKRFITKRRVRKLEVTGMWDSAESREVDTSFIETLSRSQEVPTQCFSIEDPEPRLPPHRYMTRYQKRQIE